MALRFPKDWVIRFQRNHLDEFIFLHVYTYTPPVEEECVIISELVMGVQKVSF